MNKEDKNGTTSTRGGREGRDEDNDDLFLTIRPSSTKSTIEMESPIMSSSSTTTLPLMTTTTTTNDTNGGTILPLPPTTVTAPSATKGGITTTASVVVGTILESMKYIYSAILLLFSIVIVMSTMVSKQTMATNKEYGGVIHPYITIALFWCGIVLLGMMEGTQGAIVGLQSIPVHFYQQSHPKAHRNTQLIYNYNSNHDRNENTDGTNTTTTSTLTTTNRLERFIIGRQFLVVLVVFILNTLSSAIPGASIFANVLPQSIINIFVSNGVAAILITISIGQLIAQIVSSSCMIDFMNHTYITMIEYLSLGIESSGLLHAVYIFQMYFTRTTTASSNGITARTSSSVSNNNSNDDENNIAVNQQQQSTPNEEEEVILTTTTTTKRTIVSSLFFWVRVLISVCILVFAWIVTIVALINHQTKMWDGIPVYISIIVLLLLMMIVGMLEGIQIALFAVVRRTDISKELHPMAYRNCQLIVTRPQNLPAFLIGRQILVTGCTFIVARITSVDVDIDNSDINSAETSNNNGNIFGVSDNIQYFFNTGLLGAVLTTIMASLIWRIIASSFPVAFLSNPMIYLLIRICLLIETSGICSSSWILAHLYQQLMQYKNDELYISSSSLSSDATTTTQQQEERPTAQQIHPFNLDLDEENMDSSNQQINCNRHHKDMNKKEFQQP